MSVIHKHGLRALLIGALLITLLYAWQVASAWTAEYDQANQDGTRPGPSAYAGRGLQTVTLAGTGVAAGATGLLRFGIRDSIGQLRVQDLPVLPVSKVYKLWCIDMAGTVDETAVFNIPSDSEESTVIIVAAPRLLYTYPHFRITIEPVDNHDILSGTVVMAN